MKNNYKYILEKISEVIYNLSFSLKSCNEGIINKAFKSILKALYFIFSSIFLLFIISIFVFLFGMPIITSIFAILIKLIPYILLFLIFILIITYLKSRI